MQNIKKKLTKQKNIPKTIVVLSVSYMYCIFLYNFIVFLCVRVCVCPMTIAFICS